MRSNVLTLALMLGSLPASASTIQFEQRGWTDNAGPLQVSFTGQDSDGDGSLALPELTDFRAIWNTPERTATAWRLADLQPDGFLFKNLGDYVLFASNPAFSLSGSAFDGETLSRVFDRFLFPVASSTTPPSEVPEPGSTVLLMAGVATLAAARCWRRLQ